MNEAARIAPLVSIAMCTFNGGRYLRTQLESLLQQTYPHFELVIVDDVSTDDTWFILQSYAEKDNRIRILRNDVNLGYNKNFEKAFSLCLGDYIAVSDQDDWWEPEKISEMMQQWPADAVFVYSLSRDFFGEEPVRGEENKPIRYYEGSMPAKLAFDSPIHGHACMFKKELLEKAKPFPVDVYYDWWLSMVASATGKVGCIPTTYTYHRVAGQNSSRVVLDIQSKEERTSKLRAMCLRHTETFLSLNYADAATRAVLEQYCRFLRAKKSNKFSWPLALFFFRNREICFHYKKKRNLLSIFKNSLKRSVTGL